MVEQQQPAQMQANEKRPDNKPSLIQTTTRKLSDVARQVKTQISDLATLEFKLPVETRFRNRMKAIRADAMTVTRCVDGEHHSFPPKFFLAQLEGKLETPERAVIRYTTYAVDKDGNKVVKEQYAEETTREGTTRKVLANAAYIVDKKITEVIEYGKPIQQDVVELEN